VTEAIKRVAGANLVVMADRPAGGGNRQAATGGPASSSRQGRRVRQEKRRTELRSDGLTGCLGTSQLPRQASVHPFDTAHLMRGELTDHHLLRLVVFELAGRIR
jgi:hypothetical protein